MGRSRGKATLHDKNVFYSQKEGFEPILIPYSHHLFYLRCNPLFVLCFRAVVSSFSSPGRNSQQTVHIFQIKPPFVSEFRFSIAKEIIAPDSKVSCQRDFSHGPLYESMKGREWFIPGADTDTDPTAGTYLVSHPLLRAFFHVIGPFFISIMHMLGFWTKRDRSRGAIAGAFTAFGAKVLKTEIYGLIYS